MLAAIFICGMAWLACGLTALRIDRFRHPALFTNTGDVVPFLLIVGGPCALTAALIDHGK